MRRLFRWAFRLSATVSALLFACACVLWARGYWRMDVAVLNFGDVRRAYPPYTGRSEMELSGVNGGSFEADSACGELALSFLRFHGAGRLPIGTNRPGSYPVTAREAARQAIEPAGGVRLLGWVFERYQDANFRVDFVVIPCWAAVLAAAVLPAVGFARAIRRQRARRRADRRLCPRCGYDLRATPLRCPECGAVPGGGGGSPISS